MLGRPELPERATSPQFDQLSGVEASGLRVSFGGEDDTGMVAAITGLGPRQQLAREIRSWNKLTGQSSTRPRARLVRGSETEQAKCTNRTQSACGSVKQPRRALPFLCFPHLRMSVTVNAAQSRPVNSAVSKVPPNVSSMTIAGSGSQRKHMTADRLGWSLGRNLVGGRGRAGPREAGDQQGRRGGWAVEW